MVVKGYNFVKCDLIYWYRYIKYSVIKGWKYYYV